MYKRFTHAVLILAATLFFSSCANPASPTHAEGVKRANHQGIGWSGSGGRVNADPIQTTTTDPTTAAVGIGWTGSGH